MENETQTPVFVVRFHRGEKRGDYFDVPEDMARAEYVESLKGFDEVVGVYDSCGNCGPIRPFWER